MKINSGKNLYIMIVSRIHRYLNLFILKTLKIHRFTFPNRMLQLKLLGSLMNKQNIMFIMKSWRKSKNKYKLKKKPSNSLMISLLLDYLEKLNLLENKWSGNSQAIGVKVQHKERSDLFSQKLKRMNNRYINWVNLDQKENEENLTLEIESNRSLRQQMTYNK